MSQALKPPMGESQWTTHQLDFIRYWTIAGRDCRIYLEPRPAYCDRGDWIAKIDARGPLALDLDKQDAWPRYYFDVDRAKLEIEAWLRKRGQWVELGSPLEPPAAPANRPYR